MAGLHKVAKWEEEVLIELANYLKLDPSELKLSPKNRGKTWQGHGVVFLGPSVRGSKQGEWRVFPNQRAAYKEAFALILEQAESEPEMWLSPELEATAKKEGLPWGGRDVFTPERVTDSFLRAYGVGEGIYSGSGAQGEHIKLRSNANAFGRHRT